MRPHRHSLASRLAALGLCVLSVLSVALADTELTAGVPVAGSVGRHESAYFHLPIAADQQSNTLTISVTPLSAGDPDLYVSLDAAHPDRNAPFIARGLGADALTIPTLTGKTDCYITVFGYRVSNFTVVASFGGAITLEDGVPQVGFVLDGASNHYTYQVPNCEQHTDISVSASPTVGYPQLYISNAQNPDRHDPSTYQWHTSFRQAGQAIIIRKTEANWPTNCKFYIAVYGITNSNYSVVAASNNANILLQDGLPRQEHAETHEVEYFAYELSTVGCELVITVTPLSGDPDLYVSKVHQHPSVDNSEWRGRAFGEDQVRITNASPGSYYIGVSAWVNSTFTIVAVANCSHDPNTGDSVITLLDGVPQSGSLTAGSMQYYSFQVLSGHVDVTFSISRRYGDPDLYVNAGTELPTIQHFQWRSIAWGEDLLTLHPHEPGWCNHCVYTIGVHAATETAYSLVATTSDVALNLQNGISVREDLRAGEYEYFQITVDSITDALTFTVTDLGNGDPDLFVSTRFQFPNATHHDWAAQRLRGDSITIPHPGFETYYVSVYAFASNSTFTIIANFENSTLLQDGVPQQGTVGKEVFKYYEVQVLGADHTDISISLAIDSGLANLYVNPTEQPTKNSASFQWVAEWHSASKTINIDHTDEHRCTSDPEYNECRYFIGVYGIGEQCNFTLTASTNTASYTLQDGVPQTAHAESGNFKYFSFRVDNQNQDVSFSVTPLSGDPDLFVSSPGTGPTHNNPRPTNAQTADRIAQAYGADVVDYENAALGVYYVGIKAFQNSTFTVLALVTDRNESAADNFATLFDGVPQTAVVARHHYKYYTFQVVGTSHSRLLITVSKLFGDPDLYVTHDGRVPTTHAYEWASNSFRSDSVVIRTPQPGEYKIGVYGYATASFTVTASTDAVSTTLQDGAPVPGHLEVNEPAYYQVYIDDLAKDLTIYVTPFIGLANIFVSAINNDGPSIFRPNASHHQWQHLAGTEGEVIGLTIPHTDANACTREPCFYYIAVVGVTPCNYQITARFSAAKLLEDGVAQEDEVPSGGYRYYSFRVLEGHSDLTVFVSPRTGSPELYINTNSAEFPSKEHNIWSSTDISTGEPFVIHQEDPNFCHPSSDHPECSYKIAVFGGRASNYTITVTSSEGSVRLQDGVAVREWIRAGEFEYFEFRVLEPNLQLSIIVTPFTGDPDLYISNIYERPDHTHSEVARIAFGTDIFVADNANYTHPYYIGVYGWTNTSFSIVAHLENEADTQSTVRLVDGQPQAGIVAQRSWRFYSFEIREDFAEVTITVTRLSGDPDLYIRKDQRPTTSEYLYRSEAIGIDLITMNHPDQGLYIIGVYGFTDSQYTLASSSEHSTRSLLAGVPFREFLPQAGMELFVFAVTEVLEHRDLTISVTPFSGDPDVYVDRDINVLRNNPIAAEWIGRAYAEDSITIPSTSLLLGNYYVAVTAFTNTSYTIVAHYGNSTFLQDGIPQAGAVRFEQMQYYEFEVSESNIELQITLTPSPGAAYLYVSDFMKPVFSHPNTYNRSSLNPGVGASQDMLVQVTRPARFYIGVYGRVQHQYTNFTLTVTKSSSRITTLINGRPQREWVRTNEFEYFVFEVNDAESDVTIDVTPITGDPDLYIDIDDSTLPTRDTYTWRARNFGADSITIEHTDEHFRTGPFYIGVYAWINATFYITATATHYQNNATITLAPGEPQAGSINVAHGVRYYRFPVRSSTPKRVSFSVSPRFGDPDVFIRNDGLMPHEGFGQWTGRAFGRDDVEIEQGCTDCVYDIAVVAFTPTEYSITASTSDVVTQLESGVSFTETLEAGQYAFYKVTVDESAADLSVTATAFSGDPDILVSDHDDNQMPTIQRHDFYEFAIGSDTWSLTNAAPQTYYVSVFAAATNTTYSITATLRGSRNSSAITLVDGQSHDDQLGHAHSQLYAFYNRDELLAHDVVITLAEISGALEMFVSNDGTIPSQQNHGWSNLAPDSQLRNVITIPAADSCASCRFYILVQALTDASYTISVSGANDMTLLVSGKPVQAHVARGKYRYFKYIVDRTDVDLNILATTFFGDADIYVSRQYRYPNRTHKEWSSRQALHGADHVTITHDHLTIGEYYIAVYGFLESTFSLTATVANVYLSDGQPQLVPAVDSGNFFFFNVEGTFGQETSDIRISVAGVTHQQNTFDVYLSTNATQNKPSQHNSNLPSARGVSNGQFVLISTANDVFQRDCRLACTIYIGVYASMTSPDGSEYISVTASTDSSFETVRDNAPAVGFVTQGEFYYYEMPVVAATHAFDITLESCFGDADVYAAQHTMRPNQQESDIGSSTLLDQVDHIHVNTGLQNTAIFIGVYGREAGKDDTARRAHYVLRAHLGSNTVTPPLVRDSQLSVEANSESAVTVSFLPATNGTSPDLMYELYVTERGSGAVMNTACGLEFGESMHNVATKYPITVQAGSSTITHKVTDLDATKVYVFNVLVRDGLGQKAVYTPSLANTSTVPPGHPLPMKLILGIGLPFFFIIIFVIVYLVVRNRKLSRELNVEMHDVPKSVVRKAMRGPTGAVHKTANKNNMKYSTLLAADDEEEEEVGHDYAPPEL